MTDAAEFSADGQATEELPREPRRRQRDLSVNLGGISLTDVIRESTYWIARLWFRGLFYHRTLRGRRPQVLPLIPEENWPGSSDRGAGLVEGRFRFLNHTVEADAAFSEENDAGPAWQFRLHSFEWLRDMRAVGTEGGPTLTKNAGTVETWGVESAVTAALGEYFTTYLGLAYMDSEATDIQDICGLEDPQGCEGNRLFSAPEWSGSFVLKLDYPVAGGSITSDFELFFESERGGGWEGYSYTEIDAYEEMNLRVGFQSEDNWFVQAYVENLTDEFTWDGQNNLGGKEPDVFFGPRRPRTFGLRAGYAWD